MRFRQLMCGTALVIAASAWSGPPMAAAQETSRVQSESTIAFENGRLTIDVQDRSLLEVLDRISRIARIAIVPGEDFSRNRISVAFENLPLEEGLRQVLNAYDSFFFFGVRDASPASISAVWVYSRGRGRGIQPVPPQMWASATELRDRLAHADPEGRAAAIEALIEREGHLAWSAVASALVDPEPQVRIRALYAATVGGVEIPAEVLMQALEDPSDDMRFLALQTLANGPTARAAAERARYDLSPLVRRQAEQVLKNLDAAWRQRRAAESRSQPPKQ